MIQQFKAFTGKVYDVFKTVNSFFRKLHITFLSKMVKYAFIIGGTAVAAVIVDRAVYKPIYHETTTTVVVHDSTQIHETTVRWLHDTTNTITWMTKIVEKQVPPDTIVKYQYITATDSTSLARLFLMTQVHYDHGDLSIEAVNLHQKELRHNVFSLGNDYFDVGTNSQGIWVHEHRQFVRWDGLNLGLGYNGPSGYMVAQTGLTFFQRVDLAARFTSQTQPWQVELTYKVYP